MARVTNTFVLDDGTCGRNLQLGLKDWCQVADPGLLLYADGGAGQYEIFIDGQSIGNYNGDGFGNCCIDITEHGHPPLTDGPHTVTGREIAPNPGKIVTPYSFSIDTVPPNAPSTPILSEYSDSPPVGDHITKYRNPNFKGTADSDSVSVQIFNGPTGIGGGSVVNGTYSITTLTLADGTYNVYAVAIDRAGNHSPPSGIYTFTVSQSGETNTPGAPNMNQPHRSVDLSWSISDTGNLAITQFKVYRGAFGAANELIAVLDGTTFSYRVENVEPWMYFAVSAVNALGEGPRSRNV